ncbi:MAG: PTS sugar transporter subunit IIA [Mycoplasmataceae bacterium]|nr:PTS sugar transporter subunit IIA [Mycoplasmataceae bacterium]
MFSKEKIIFLNKKINSKNDLFEIIADKAVELNISNDKQEVFNGLVDRENQGSTGFQEGFGIPHCKTNAIKKPSVLFIKSKYPIKWDTFDKKPLENMFALLIPEDNASEHLQILAKISRKLMNKDFRNSIKSAKNPDDILVILKEI